MTSTVITIKIISEYPSFEETLAVVRKTSCGLSEECLHRLARAYEGCMIAVMQHPYIEEIPFMIDAPEEVADQIVDKAGQFLADPYGIDPSSMIPIVVEYPVSK